MISYGALERVLEGRRDAFPLEALKRVGRFLLALLHHNECRIVRRYILCRKAAVVECSEVFVVVNITHWATAGTASEMTTQRDGQLAPHDRKVGLRANEERRTKNGTSDES